MTSRSTPSSRRILRAPSGGGQSGEEPRLSYDADVIIVGSGLAGLVAAAELADAGKRVIIVDQEPEQSLGGQAFWSLGGLVPGRYSRTAPAGRERLLRARPRATGWERPASTARKTTGRGSGPRPMWRLPPVRHGRGCFSKGCAGFRSWDGPSAAGMGPLATAIPYRDFTSPGAPGPGVLEPFVRRTREAEKKGLITFKFRHRVDELLLTNGAVDGVRGAILEPSDVARGVKSSRTVVGEFTLRAGAVIVASGGIGGNHELVRQNWPTAPGQSAQVHGAGRAGPCGRPDAGHHRGGRSPVDQSRSDVALHRGHPELEPDLAQPRHSHLARAVVTVAGRDR